ncbi:MAG: hypothetical protein Q7R95_11335 [bacterium]|nr:hypothetical protein [bacterium]
MKQNRAQKIKLGKIWQVYPDSNGDDVKFEGSKSACIKYLKENKLWRSYKIGKYRVGQLIF